MNALKSISHKWRDDLFDLLKEFLSISTNNNNFMYGLLLANAKNVHAICDEIQFVRLKNVVISVRMRMSTKLQCIVKWRRSLYSIKNAPTPPQYHLPTNRKNNAETTVLWSVCVYVTVIFMVGHLASCVWCASRTNNYVVIMRWQLRLTETVMIEYKQ